MSRVPLAGRDDGTELRRHPPAAGIERVLLPWHLESGTTYDKWGNACLPDGARAIGKRFFDDSV